MPTVTYKPRIFFRNNLWWVEFRHMETWDNGKRTVSPKTFLPGKSVEEVWEKYRERMGYDKARMVQPDRRRVWDEGSKK